MPISFANLLGATIPASPSPRLNQPRPRAIFSSFGLLIPFRRPSPDQSNSDRSLRVISLFAISLLFQKFIPRASDRRFGRRQISQILRNHRSADQSPKHHSRSSFGKTSFSKNRKKPS